MKNITKPISIILSVFMLMSVLVAAPFSVSAADENYITGDCTWTLNHGTLTISGNGAMGDYSYDKPAPWGRDITTVVIETGVTHIGKDAFRGCKRLTSVILPNSVRSIGNNVFSDCTNLTSVEIPYGVESISDWVFAACSSLTSVTLPNSVTSIGNWAFAGCETLSAIEIPDSVISIGRKAFVDCTSLFSVTIPESVTSIGDWAFGYQHDILQPVPIEGFTICGKSGTAAEIYANDNHFNFVALRSGTTGGCRWTLDDTGKLIISERLYGNGAMADYANFISLPWGVNITSVEIKDGVTRIGNGAFFDCVSLTSVTIPESVTYIGDWAFTGCEMLTSVTIPNNVSYIGDWAFWGCEMLTCIAVPNSVTSIGEKAFADCLRLKNIMISSSVTSIGDRAFGYRYDNLCFVPVEGVTICGNPSTTAETYANDNHFNFVPVIGDLAFAYCKSLNPDITENIDAQEFFYCTSLTPITIPDRIKSIAPNATLDNQG